MPISSLWTRRPNAPEANRFTGSSRRADGTTSMMRTADGVAIIPVLDTLVNRGAWLDSRSGLTSYEGIAAQLRAAGSDPEVRSVLLDISSPGGEAAGMAGLADLIRSVRQTKPVTAFVNDMAASAAYGIASAANEIVISPTSILGSIGVVMLHADRSGELAAQGVKPTLIFAGSHKVDGNPFEPLVGCGARRPAGQRRCPLPPVPRHGRGGPRPETHRRHGARHGGPHLHRRGGHHARPRRPHRQLRRGAGLTLTDHPPIRAQRSQRRDIHEHRRDGRRCGGGCRPTPPSRARLEAPAPQPAAQLEEAVAAARARGARPHPRHRERRGRRRPQRRRP